MRRLLVLAVAPLALLVAGCTADQNYTVYGDLGITCHVIPGHDYSEPPHLYYGTDSHTNCSDSSGQTYLQFSGYTELDNGPVVFGNGAGQLTMIGKADVAPGSRHYFKGGVDITAPSSFHFHNAPRGCTLVNESHVSCGWGQWITASS